jgi:thiol-disulfide isomerase/thioredoxin
MRNTGLILILLASACERTELESPKVGSCSEATEANQWPYFDGSAGEPPLITETGWEEGQVPPDFELVDQFGAPTCLWQMYGHYVVLDVSALWCVPCQDIAETVACQQETFVDLVYMTFITQDADSQPADLIHAQQWAENFGLDDGTLTPVIADGGEVFTSQFPGDGTLPTLVLLDPELKMVTWGVGEEADVGIRAELESALGVDVDVCLSEGAR